MLTILRVIDQHLSSPNAKATTSQLRSSIRRDDFKIIYVYAMLPFLQFFISVHKMTPRAPMKALAAEIVRKLGKRLAWLSIRVQELTGKESPSPYFST